MLHRQEEPEYMGVRGYEAMSRKGWKGMEPMGPDISTSRPNFLIVGVMKAATTTLSDYLNLHPNIHIPTHEIHFFNADDKYKKGIGYYQSFFTPMPDEYRVGEKTPTYSYHQTSPGRIAQFNPDIKLIWIFRNPTLRAYSHYWFFVQNGQERYSFETAIEWEPLRKIDNIGYSYVDRGLYIHQLERYLQYFPRENMLFLLYEDFKKNPIGTIRKCFEFLELPVDVHLKDMSPSRNITRLPRSVFLQYLAYKYFYRKFRIGYKMVSKLNLHGRADYPPLADKTRKQLNEFYYPYNIQFSKLTGLDISSWQS